MLGKCIKSLCIIASFLNLYMIFKGVPASASKLLRPRGVSMAMASFYDPARPFSCLDGSGTFPFNIVNDDFCDCKDGSDEPGTAACIGGSFHCNNLGHVGVQISSSFVNDGVCDCCDTSDEYASSADCLDVCQALGEAARVEARHEAQVQLEGYNLRQKLAEEGVNIKKEKQVRLSELIKEKEKAEIVHAEKLAEKEAAEAPESEALEQYKAIEEEIKIRKEQEQRSKDKEEAEAAFTHLDADSDGVLTIQELQSKEIFDTNKDGQVSEDEAKFYMHQKDSIELEEFLTSGWALISPTYKHHKRMYIPPKAKSSDETDPSEEREERQVNEFEDLEEEKDIESDYDSNLDSQDDDAEEEEEEDYAEEMDDSETNKAKETAEEEEIEYDEETRRLIDIASSAREEFTSADNHLRDLAKEIQNIKDGLEKDFGPNDEFRPFEGSCFEFTDREYTYKLCLFDSAVQKPKSGHGETRLGTWGNWEGPAGNPYSIMKYTGGQACWNGPQRSAEVRLSCGTESQLTAVSEPNKCEYLFLFTTPAICIQPDDFEYLHQHTEL